VLDFSQHNVGGRVRDGEDIDISINTEITYEYFQKLFHHIREKT